MRDDYTLRLLIERLERTGASEQAIVTAVREATRADEQLPARRPERRPRRLLRRPA